MFITPVLRADIPRPIRMHITHTLAKKRGASRPPSSVPACTRRTNAREQGANCEPRVFRGPLDTRAIPKAPHRTFVAISQLYGDVGFASLPGLL